MWLPLRGENLWIAKSGSPGAYAVILDFVITLRSQPNLNSGPPMSGQGGGEGRKIGESDVKRMVLFSFRPHPGLPRMVRD